MVAERQTILHSDMNSFYASVEAMLDPSLKGKAIAVCGATEDRHGIVLAKSEKAKKRGVKTGMVNFEARQKCPDLILVPPQYDQYLKYSKLAHTGFTRGISVFSWGTLVKSSELFGKVTWIVKAADGRDLCNAGGRRGMKHCCALHEPVFQKILHRCIANHPMKAAQAFPFA